MKKKTSPFVITFGVLSLVLFLIWVALFILALMPTDASTTFMDAFATTFVGADDAIWESLLKFDLPGGYFGAYAGWVVIALSLILFIAGISVGAVKKRSAPVLAGLMILLSAVPLLDLVIDVCYILDDTISYTSDYIRIMIQQGNTTDLIVGIGIISSAVLAYLFSIIYFAGACAQPKAVAPVVGDIPEEANSDLNYVAADETSNNDYEEMNAEPVPVFVPEPEPTVEGAQKQDVNETVVHHVVDNKDAIDKDTLVALMKEVVRDIVRDEVARATLDNERTTTHSNAHNCTVTGATFGGPLIVQYFNGVTPNQSVEQPKPEPVKEEEPKVEKIIHEHIFVAPIEEEKEEEPKEEVKEEPAPEPVKEEVKEEPAPEPVVEEVKEEPVVEEVKEEPVVEPMPAPAPVVSEPVVEPVPEVEKPKIIRIPFEERIVNAEQEMKDNYNELKNEILSYGVKSRVSNSGDTFRLHRKTYVKITIAGKSLKLYFALNPEDYRESTIPVQDAGDKNVYSEIPLVFKVKSSLSLKRAKILIQEVMEKDDLEQGEVGQVDWVNEIAVEMKNEKKR